MQRVKDELGLSAIILSIKRKPRRGLCALFKKPTVIVTAAYEEKTSAEKLADEQLQADKQAVQQKAQSFLKSQGRPTAASAGEPSAVIPLRQPPAKNGLGAGNMMKDVQLSDQQQRIESLQSKLNATEDLLAKVFAQLNIAEQMARKADARKYDNNMIQMFFESLVGQGVAPEIAEKLLENADSIDERDNIDISLIIKIVYNNIIEILGEPRVVEVDTDRQDVQVVAFMGPTGVGKTTTIAKLSSILTINYYMRVGLITADTYRIAAVEQLKTYADILGLDVQVVYNPEDIENNVDRLRPLHDVVLIDTAGRSHRKEETLAELKEMLDCVPDCQRYLVLSVTTKYEDLLSIVNAYKELTDFDLIFTKLDETAALGSILNICYLTGKQVSYITFGQNVPDDIEIAQPDKIAKALLGLSTASGDGQVSGRGGGYY